MSIYIKKIQQYCTVCGSSYLEIVLFSLNCSKLYIIYLLKMEVFKAPVLEFKLFGIRFVSHVLTFIWLFKKVVIADQCAEFANLKSITFF